MKVTAQTIKTFKYSKEEVEAILISYLEQQELIELGSQMNLEGLDETLVVEVSEQPKVIINTDVVIEQPEAKQTVTHSKPEEANILSSRVTEDIFADDPVKRSNVSVNLFAQIHAEPSKVTEDLFKDDDTVVRVPQSSSDSSKNWEGCSVESMPSYARGAVTESKKWDPFDG